MMCRSWTACTLFFWLFSATATAADTDTAFLGRSLDQWLERCQSQQPGERVEAAWALAQLAGHNQAKGALALTLAILAGDDNPTLRYWGIHGLGRLALATDTSETDRQLIKEKLRTLLADKSPAPRIAASEALGMTGDAERALSVLVEAMRDPQDAVRIQAVAALEKLGNAAKPAEATLRAATSDSSEYVKRISTRALERLSAEKR